MFTVENLGWSSAGAEVRPGHTGQSSKNQRTWVYYNEFKVNRNGSRINDRIFQKHRGLRRFGPADVKELSSRERLKETPAIVREERTFSSRPDLKPRPHPLSAFLILFWESSDQYHRQDSRARQKETHLRSRPQQR
ncbi:hypothetical protein E3U43_013007 [Larimichthys crocea]|uniref:Uncharacterized protein n=1 Tax=Larimichthys crocea TaxID=215358 RepID=A0ACD3R987_LARCR|nr:hypothetical protein E3U43_013007 [Larimichthys crocea]